MTRYGHGLIVGKFYPPHAGHHHLIDLAAGACDRLTVVVAPSSGESFGWQPRVGWLRERHPGVDVVGGFDDHPIDYDDRGIWDLHCAVFRELAGVDRVDAVFSSEAYGAELAARFQAVHVSVDPGRGTVPVSGTAVREDPIAHWRSLSAPVRGFLAKRVIVVGAESTGTTTMARALAGHYRRRWPATRWVPEYGRELTERKLAVLRAERPDATVSEVTWDSQDFLDVATVQNAAEDTAARLGSPVLFGDTDARATAVWQERYLGESSPEVRAMARVPALYLLTDDAGVPFEDDGLRDGEHIREWMTGRLRTILAESGAPVVELAGRHALRLSTAVRAVDELLAAGWYFAPPLTAGSGRPDDRQRPEPTFNLAS